VVVLFLISSTAGGGGDDSGACPGAKWAEAGGMRPQCGADDRMQISLSKAAPAQATHLGSVVENANPLLKRQDSAPPRQLLAVPKVSHPSCQLGAALSSGELPSWGPWGTCAGTATPMDAPSTVSQKRRSKEIHATVTPGSISPPTTHTLPEKGQSASPDLWRLPVVLHARPLIRSG
jgi:hypothetical protein